MAEQRFYGRVRWLTLSVVLLFVVLVTFILIMVLQGEGFSSLFSIILPILGIITMVLMKALPWFTYYVSIDGDSIIEYTSFRQTNYMKVKDIVMIIACERNSKSLASFFAVRGPQLLRKSADVFLHQEVSPALVKAIKDRRPDTPIAPAYARELTRFGPEYAEYAKGLAPLKANILGENDEDEGLDTAAIPAEQKKIAKEYFAKKELEKKKNTRDILIFLGVLVLLWLLLWLIRGK